MITYRSDVVGSLLRPAYLKEARQRFDARAIGAAEFKKIEDRAVDEAIALQTRAGVEVITDGEMRRDSFFGHLIDAVEGFDKLGGGGVKFRDEQGGERLFRRPVVVSRLRRRRHMCAEEFTYLRARADRPAKATLVTAIANKPGVVFALHVCRGNNQSKFYASGGYDPIAAKVFSRSRFQRFLLEYDDARSGGFEPLRDVPEDRTVVLGLITTKKATLEKKDDLKRRIREAEAFAPLERLALSPQCGFASVLEGNLLSPAEQEAKLKLVAETAREVWGGS